VETTHPSLDRLAYSPAEAWKAIGIGRTAFYSAITDGRLKARRLGRRVLIERSELRRFIEALPDARPAKSAT
jgi:excisionase family DNA binding protein